MPDVLVLIPARMASSRLPGKPLADIAGEPMIVHVWRRAMEAKVGPVWVATDSAEIAAAVEKSGGRAVMTRSDHPSGTDRIHEVVAKIGPGGGADIVVNVQGDLPTLDPGNVADAVALLANPAVDIGTLAAEITKDRERDDPNVVKVVGSPVGPARLRALYFTRARAPFGDGALYHHIGLYAFRRAALDRFVALPPSPLEQREKLEQLRALEAGMRIDVAIVAAVPLGVDTPEDLETARAMLTSKTS
ncbi:MAG TPA: 3-deoxy-manno-octulosonate cytidylyltransferase [Xanthobacteraceae bacterium]|nr:3-deoxy-manno-octulosonate cytidylyltransferase [Xanthobacteraceae bacterium]